MHPVFDYGLIGGGLSLVMVAVVMGTGQSDLLPLNATLSLLLLSNSCHFAASTVRLYTKPGTRESLPFLTMLFPVVTLGVTTLCILAPRLLGQHLVSLYLTWSPYHYAAQAYGLAVMYCHRSGCRIDAVDQRLLRWVSLLPFFLYFLSPSERVGLRWLVPPEVIGIAAVEYGVSLARLVLPPLSLLMIAVAFGRVWQRGHGVMPLVSVLTLVANSIWFVVLPSEGFLWATVFHEIQYLAIIIVFHVKQQLALPGNQHGAAYHALWFYAACLALGYGLFYCMPLGFMVAGFGGVESTLLVVAAINLHHFIVDGYIWKQGRSDSNRRIVESGAPSAAYSAAG